VPSHGSPRLSDAASGRAVVVGGGVAGLLAAERLLDAGFAVTLLEATTRLGGLLRTEYRDGCLLEHGPDSIVTSKPAGMRLLERLRLLDRTLASGPGGASIAWRDRLHPIPTGTVLGVPTSLRAIARSSLFGRGHALSMALDLVAPSRPLDGDVSVGHLVRRRLGSAAVDRLVGPLLGGISGGDIDELSAAAAFPQLVAWERDHGSLIRGARATAAQRTGASPFLSLHGGMGQLVDALVRRLERAEIALGEPVQRITRGQRTAHRVETTERTLDADVVVLAVVPPGASQLLSDDVPDAGAALAAIATRSTALVHAAFDASAVDPMGHGFVVADRERHAITGVTDVSAKWPHRAPPHTTLLRVYLGPDVPSPGETGDARAIEVGLRGLRRFVGVRDDPRFAIVERIPDAMPQPTVGHVERVTRIRAELLAGRRRTYLVAAPMTASASLPSRMVSTASWPASRPAEQLLHDRRDQLRPREVLAGRWDAARRSRRANDRCRLDRRPA
jgi:oxygen-dependent protoporphyrinogen oxidase